MYYISVASFIPKYLYSAILATSWTGNSSHRVDGGVVVFPKTSRITTSCYKNAMGYYCFFRTDRTLFSIIFLYEKPILSSFLELHVLTCGTNSPSASHWEEQSPLVEGYANSNQKWVMLCKHLCWSIRWHQVHALSTVIGSLPRGLMLPVKWLFYLNP